MRLSVQLLEAIRRKGKRKKKLSRAARGIIGPVFRAQPKGFNLPNDQATYWAKRARATEFGTYIIKALIRIRNPYIGTDSQAWDVAAELSDQEVKRILGSEGDGYDEDIYDSPDEQFVELLVDEHEQGIWQDRAILRAIQRADYDGVWSNDPHGGEAEYVVFHPKQVKVLDTFRKDRKPIGSKRR